MLKRKKKIIAKVMATTMLASTLATTFTSTVNAAEPRATVSETSIAGGDRYKTAVEISKNYTSTSKHAVIVNGEKGIVDALTATPYASLKKAPILMTQSTTLNSDTKAELTRRGIKTVDIVGGTKSVDDKVKAEIEAMGITVNRIAGIDKYDTALKVAKEIDRLSDISKIAVANGEKFVDAVSVAAPAAQNKMPIILVHPTNGLDAETKKYIDSEGISTSYVIGGTSSVSEATKNSLPGTKERLSGTGRQETNAAVVKKFYTSSTYDNIYVAKSGEVNKADEIADALAVGVLAASKKDPVMLVGNSLVNDQKTLLEGKKVEKITKVGNGIPTASINAIKDTQKDPEATVSSVTLVNYKTIKITGKELNRIDKSKVSISGNTTSSYTPNSAGTEATIEFASAFSNGTNTVKVTSNLGTVTSHTFTYSTGISTVEATTKEVGTEGIQYLEFTVNGGQKRTIEELKALGWTVEFKSSKNIFYNENNPSSPLKTSKTGKLMNKLSQAAPSLIKDDVFDYEVILTKGTQTIKTSEKKSVTIVDSATDLASIKSYDATFTSRGSENNSFKSNKLLVGETIALSNIKGIRNDGKEITLTSGTTLKSSDSTILTVSGMNITARKDGTATITISNDNITKTVTIQVLKSENNARQVQSVSYYVGDTNTSSIVLTKSSSATSVKVKAVDQYGDPINALTTLEKSTVTTEETNPKTIANVSKAPGVAGIFTNGEATINITPISNKTGTGIVKMQKTVGGNTVDLGSLTVIIQKAEANIYTYDFTIDSGSEDLILDRYSYMDDEEVILKFNTYDSNGNLRPATDITQTENNKDKYVIKVSDEDLIRATKVGTSGNIRIVPTSGKAKTGTATVNLYEVVNNTEEFRASANIVIQDTVPTISTIDMNEVQTITKINATDAEFDLLDLFKINYTKRESTEGADKLSNELFYKKVIEGVKVAKGSTGELYENQEVLMSLTNASAGGTGAEAILFIDRTNNNGDKNGKFDNPNPSYHTNGDLVLATIKIEASGVTMTTPSAGKRKLNAATNNGSIIVAMYDGMYELNKTPKDTVINVEIPR